MYTPVPHAESLETGACSSPVPVLAPSTCYLVAINSYSFAYSLVACTLGVVVLPSEAMRLFMGQHAVMLGVMLGCTGVTQLISPAIGYLSDRSTSRHGRRRPLLVTGGVISCLGCLAMYASRSIQMRYFYILALTTTITGMNIRQACPLRHGHQHVQDGHGTPLGHQHVHGA